MRDYCSSKLLLFFVILLVANDTLKFEHAQCPSRIAHDDDEEDYYVFPNVCLPTHLNTICIHTFS